METGSDFGSYLPTYLPTLLVLNYHLSFFYNASRSRTRNWKSHLSLFLILPDSQKDIVELWMKIKGTESEKKKEKKRWGWIISVLSLSCCGQSDTVVKK